MMDIIDHAILEWSKVMPNISLPNIEQVLHMVVAAHGHEFEIKEPGKYRLGIGWDNGPVISVEKTF